MLFSTKFSQYHEANSLPSEWSPGFKSIILTLIMVALMGWPLFAFSSVDICVASFSVMNIPQNSSKQSPGTRPYYKISVIILRSKVRRQY